MRYSFVLAADKSGSGKTTLTCGLINVLKKREVKVQSFKCGPDYIDPMFHRKVLGVPAANLDSFFVSKEMLRTLYTERAEQADISVIEGVMGYYDGLGGVSVEGSTWEIADIIDSPTVLVMDCKGASVSIAAMIRGMLDFGKTVTARQTGYRDNTCEHLPQDESPLYIDDRNGNTGSSGDDRMNDSGIRGVILNRVSPVFYERLKGVIEENCPEIKVLGYLPEMKNLAVPSRHLGLIEPGDMEDFNSWIEAVSDQIEKTVDVDGILELAGTTKSGKTHVKKISEFRDGSVASEISRSVDSDLSRSDNSFSIQSKVGFNNYENHVDLNVYTDFIRGSEIRADHISDLRVNNKVKLGIAEDEAFNFYYQENRELLEKMGAELVPFSPLHDEKLPEDLDGVIIGGGYPELYAEKLSQNVSMREALVSCIKGGMPVIAECGGYMYLNSSICTEDSLETDKICHNGSIKSGCEKDKNRGSNKKTTENTHLESRKQFEMCGVFSGEATKKQRLVRFGYISAETKLPGLFGEAGTVLKGHEFHRYDCEYNGDGFVLRKPMDVSVKNSSTSEGKQPVYDGMKSSRGNTSEFYEKYKTSSKPYNISGGYEGIYYSETMSCGWPHFYYYSNPKAIFNYMKCCERYHFEKEARKKWDGIAKPIDSLGILEKEVIKLCGIQRTLTPSIDKKALVVLCADHGCVKEGVSQTDSSVTRKVADSFANGETTTAILAETNGVVVYTIDVGMIGPRYVEEIAETNEKKHKAYSSKNVEEILNDESNSYSAKLSAGRVNDRRLQDGSGNIAVEAAMSREIGEKALNLGMDIVKELKEAGYRIICTGEMGIGNTTPTAALLAYFMGNNAEDAVGYGAGLSEEGLRRKQDVVRRALKRLKNVLGQEENGDESVEKTKADVSERKVKTVSAVTAKEALYQIGGLEIAVMAGMFLGGIRYEVPVVIDGIISTAAALSAFMMDERVSEYTLASHISKEKLARKALEKMGLRAIIDAEMSLGEGSGAVLLMPILSSAVEVFNRMGTFNDMKVEAYHRFEK
ncbi:nicotinate-nucleotide--dimethylbenzimidazole phosphoribosyltransferase [Oribacterium sp. WCC10]|uniref:nicotinate-nucleotide--dimethylbenzimidazole phosphoribosyltransferase n=1 Tax=Oribacterium sp. WCC10 TaxID=1855343 RepID=UPI0008F373CA|nr:nicotinate-nucleotide--dimethylbenzimidazole phosphoribosyltransferase [Oribacterium sp. WCC10]SFG74203.1 CobQ/CobB/MinD/ParA nucleotide binding domain-containing protein [Oribacterium sp. WCC10]